MNLPLRRLFYTTAMVGLLSVQPADALETDDPSALLDQAQTTLVSDSATGIKLAREAAELERQEFTPDQGILLRAAWLEAEGLFRLRRLDEAALVLKRTLNEIGSESSDIYGKLLITSGRVARARGDNGLALQSFQDAFKLFSKLDNSRYQAIALQSIGTLYKNAKQYERAIKYDERAVEAYPDDPLIKIVSLNNRANALRELERYDEARALLLEALQQDIVASAPNFAVRLQANLAALELSAGNIESATSAVQAVESLSADIAENQMPVLPYAVKAKIAFVQGDMDAAVRTLNEAFSGIDFETTPEDESEAHALAYDVYEALGQDRAALAHLKALKRLEDAERDVAASANSAIANAEFELSDKTLQIEKLSRERAEADLELVRTKRSRDRMLFGGLVGLAMAAIGVLVWFAWQSRRVSRVTEALNKQLEAVNAKLRRSNVELEKANSAKTEFLATTSHEVRTPLNAVINLTADVLEGSQLSTDEQRKLSTALRSAEHLHEIVTDILDVARFEGKRVPTHFSNISIKDVAADVVNLWQAKATSKGLRFRTQINPADAPFCTDEKLLRQVLSNLLSNAIKFTPHGSVELKISGGSATEPLMLQVSDSGIGIDDANRDLIFESFKQVDTGGTRSFQGTGLGLAICKQIATLLGGSIDVQSQVGYGTTFTVVIPMSEAEDSDDVTETAPPAIADVEGSIGGLHVLAAEDNAVNAMVIQTILKGKVETLTIVENGQEAVDAVNAGD
ncbi:MAG: ATP-binding protein, partial [Pseudomonadota bacterium]